MLEVLGSHRVVDLTIACLLVSFSRLHINAHIVQNLVPGDDDIAPLVPEMSVMALLRLHKKR